MQELRGIKNISDLRTPFYVTAIRADMIGTNGNLELSVDDVRCVLKVEDSDYIIIQNTPGVNIRTSVFFSTFRLAYKNEVKKCK